MDGFHASDTEYGVMPVTRRFVGVVGGVRSRPCADTVEDPADNAPIETIATVAAVHHDRRAVMSSSVMLGGDSSKPPQPEQPLYPQIVTGRREKA